MVLGTASEFVAEEIQTIRVGNDIKCLHILPNPWDDNILEVFFAPSWYDISNDRDVSQPRLSTRHYYARESVDVQQKKIQRPPFPMINTEQLTFCQPVGFHREKNLVLICADVDGITWRRNTPGVNPIDQIFIKTFDISKTTGDIVNSLAELELTSISPEMVGDLSRIRHGTRPNSVYTMSNVFSVSGMFDGTTGYYLGLSGNKNAKSHLWMFSFSAPDFSLQWVYPHKILEGRILRYEGEPLVVNNYTHIASSFLGEIPLIAYRNGQNDSIHVIDYDPELFLSTSPSREVRLPEEYQETSVEDLLMAVGMEAAYLGIVFSGKGEEKSKRFLLFERIKGTTEWKEFASIDLPKDSFSPTMCVHNDALFYAYLQSVVVDNPPEIADRFGETRPDKKITIFKYPLNRTR
jgi:hypothetical protein